MRSLPSIDRFDVMRVTGLLGGADTAPYGYVEIIDIADMDQFAKDIASPAMRTIAARFGELAEVTFMTTEPLAAV